MLIPIVVENYQETGMKSLLIIAVISLVATIKFLYSSKEKAIAAMKEEMKESLKQKDDSIKQKDDRILEVIKNHQNDLKESNNDMKLVIEKYHEFTKNIKDLVDVRK